ncbi:hypothetical protein BU17DRAFT_93054 [Hysterangium stoloniferum]|nr:hypothetical protein BU17DRAFT_93054 [Hysterangium stoloniferum]
MPPLSFLFPPRSIASTKNCRRRSEPRLSSIGLPVLFPTMFLQIAKNRQFHAPFVVSLSATVHRIRKDLQMPFETAIIQHQAPRPFTGNVSTNGEESVGVTYGSKDEMTDLSRPKSAQLENGAGIGPPNRTRMPQLWSSLARHRSNYLPSTRTSPAPEHNTPASSKQSPGMASLGSTTLAFFPTSPLPAHVALLLSRRANTSSPAAPSLKDTAPSCARSRVDST